MTAVERAQRPASADNEGLLCAFQLDPCLPIAGHADDLVKSPKPVWLHFSLADTRARAFLEQRAPMPEEARAALVEPRARVHLQAFQDGFVTVLGDLHHDFDADPDGFGVLRVYVDEHVMITCREHRLTCIDRLRVRIEALEESQSTFALFEELVHELVEGFARVSGKLSETIEDAEDEILAGRFKDQRAELGRVRRLLARLRRHVNANKSALLPLPKRLGVLDSEQRQRLREVIELLDAVGQDLELVTERARLLQEEIAGRLGEATNRNLYLLSILTTTLLPITLITGIFGMNVGGLPFGSSNHGFWSVVVIMGVTVLGTLAFLRRSDVL
jgi:zinc transporter